MTTEYALTVTVPAGKNAMMQFIERNIAWAVVVLGSLFLTLSVGSPEGLAWTGITLAGLAVFFDCSRNSEGKWPKLQYILLWVIGGNMIGAAADERMVFMGVTLIALGLFTAIRKGTHELVQKQRALVAEQAVEKEDPRVTTKLMPAPSDDLDGAL